MIATLLLCFCLGLLLELHMQKDQKTIPSKKTDIIIVKVSFFSRLAEVRGATHRMRAPLPNRTVCFLAQSQQPAERRL